MTVQRTTRELRPRKSPCQTRSRATVDAILGAAAQVFAAHGYAAGTTNRIAARAGVSIGSLYEYFPNKDALLVALLEAHIAEGEEVLQRTASEVLPADLPLHMAVRRLVAAMVELHARDPQLHRVLFEEAPLPRRVRRMLADTERRVTTLVEHYLTRHPEFRRDDAALAAGIVVQTVEALTHKLIVHEGRATDICKRIDEIAALVVEYLTAATSE